MNATWLHAELVPPPPHDGLLERLEPAGIALAVVGFLAALANHAHAGLAGPATLFGGIKPEEVTAWVTTGFAAAILILSTLGRASRMLIFGWRRLHRRRPHRAPQPRRNTGENRPAGK